MAIHSRLLHHCKDIVEIHKLLCQSVLVGRDHFTELGKSRIPIATVKVTKQLIVGPVSLIM